MSNWDVNRVVGTETRKSYKSKIESGFLDKYLSGENILEIGNGSSDTIVPNAIGVDKGYPGYDNLILPFADQSQDAVYSSHCLEHIDDYKTALLDWFRVLKVGGYMIIAVPHFQLYEKKKEIPSRWNPDHKRFYHPITLLEEIYEALPFGEWRLRQCIENDDGFDYTLPCDVHSKGAYEIEVVIQKIERFAYIDKI